MKPRNLISVFQGDAAIELVGAKVDKQFKILKKHEIRNLSSFCSIMSENGCSMRHYEDFFVGYTIAQIGKEFDLLRFGREYNLNIEIKSELKVAQKEKKILDQMRKNFYYLKFLHKPARIYMYVENDGFYLYDEKNDSAASIGASAVAECLITHSVDNSIDPDREFVPSNYLISPFNSTDLFIKGEYFLTPAQQKIKAEVNEELLQNPFMFFCLSANAGTGKTLLMYDIAKEMQEFGKKVLIIHCGRLNPGHERLANNYKWSIWPIRNVSNVKENVRISEFDFIFVDESQRIRNMQLSALIESAIENGIPLFFSYDTKQYLKTGETLDLGEFLHQNYPEVELSKKSLTNKIRTNKAMASFITNMFELGKSHDNLNYDCVTVDYFADLPTARSYISLLLQDGWTPITYTTSTIDPDPYDDLAEIASKNAHGVIGQEFPKVVFVMDDNFTYSENGKLTVKPSYYNARGMLYQIVTRVIDELKIIVVNNPQLYVKLLEIKAMGN